MNKQGKVCLMIYCVKFGTELISIQLACNKTVIKGGLSPGVFQNTTFNLRQYSCDTLTICIQTLSARLKGKRPSPAYANYNKDIILSKDIERYSYIQMGSVYHTAVCLIL